MDLKPYHIPILIMLAVILSPLIIIVALTYFSMAIYVRVWAWLKFRRGGKGILFVYSNSPNWQKYIEAHILPVISDHSYILNWSERKTWSWSQKSAVNHILGNREYCPAAAQFSGFWRITTIRFFGAFKKHKKGRSDELHVREKELRECVQTAA